MARTARRAIRNGRRTPAALLFAGDCGKDGQTDLFVTTLNGQPQQITHLKGYVEHAGVVAGLASASGSSMFRVPLGQPGPWQR